MYGLEAFDQIKLVLRSSNFSANRFCMQLFNATNISNISKWQRFFNFRLPSFLLTERSRKLISKMDVTVLS
jgi:hypothetical protein